MQHQVLRNAGRLPEPIASSAANQTQQDPRWNLVHSLEPAADLRTSVTRNKLVVGQQHGAREVHPNEEDEDEDRVSIISTTRSQSRASSRDGTSMIEGTRSYSRASDELDALVECFRDNVEESFRRQQQLGPCLEEEGRRGQRADSSSRSSACPTPNSTCELVSALQNHLKSAVAMATAAATAAAVAAAANAATTANHHHLHHHHHHQNQTNPVQLPNLRDRTHGSNTTSSSNNLNNHNNSNPTDSNHHELIPLDLKMLPDYEMWHNDETRSSRSDEEDADVDLISIGSNDSGRVQHTEIVQTTTLDPGGPFESKLSNQARLINERLAPMAGTITSTNSTTIVSSQHQSTFASSNSTSSSSAYSNPNTNQQQQQSSPASSHGHHVKQRRLYKCRHCPFETDKKVENWQHIRIHMRPEKLLSCGSCLFVTEYKHHLEYHQRNHTGYKPFKCEHCDYTCVNKSMLNSHMKSHSSVYQYQCGDCKYATKYVHSLKMHLRKYNHQPAALMIDIFGRKRGPKPGSGRKQQQQQQQQQKQQQNATKPNSVNGSSSSKSKSQKQQQQQQQHQCKILDLRVNSKLDS